MTGATLFSGIGSPETAMPGWRWPWHAEIERFPNAVMGKRHSDSINLGDVTADGFAERASEIASPDVLVFGSPCQDFSVAGRRAGMDGKRGNLSLVALGILGRLRPRWFCFENVPGLLSIDGGDGFRFFLRRVDELGYSGAWGSLDAQYFGLAQRRNRVFFVGHSGDWRYPAAVLLEPESLCGNTAPRRQAGEGVAPTIASRPSGGGGLGTDFDCDGGLIAGSLGTRSAAHPSGMKHEADFMVSACLNGGGMGRIDAETETFIPVTSQGGDFDGVAQPLLANLRADGFDASEDGTGRGTPLVASYRTSGNCGAWDTGDRVDALTTGTDPGSHLLAFSSKDHGADAGKLAPTLRSMGHDGSHANGGGQLAIAFQTRIARNGRGQPSEIAPALNGADAGATSDMRPVVATSSMVRRLTPLECERLQGFPDGYTAITYRGKPAADGPRYKALGNSMAVPVMRWILSRIEQVSQ